MAMELSTSQLRDALTTITLEAPADPDAQATVNDFLDYTEYFPSDLIRSLTLIRKLDHDYKDATAKVHELTTIYGALPTLPAAGRPEPQELRTQISVALERAISLREAAYAEAHRLADVAERAGTRLTSIKKKLQALPQPPSRDPTPAPISPQQTRAARKPEVERVQRITLHVDGARRSVGSRGPKHRQILVPGDILPPRGPDDDIYTESEVESAVESVEDDLVVDDALKSEGIRAVTKTPKSQRLKLSKPQRPRPQGVMGTNVHSSVAGISTSNALAMLTPPPQDAKPGSKHKPWFKLTEFEMARLRKQMKKNAIWTPSDTMIRRELAITGRGRDHYETAKAHAEATGEPLLDEDPVDPSKTELAPGEVSWTTTPGKSEADLVNRGMRLNEAKKSKKEQQAKIAAAEAVQLEEANKGIAKLDSTFKNLFDSNKSTPISDNILERPGTAPKKSSSSKRKRGKENQTAVVDLATTSIGGDDALSTSGPKRIKISNVPIAPRPTFKKQVPPPIKTITNTTSIPLAPPGPSSSPKSATTRYQKTPASAVTSPTDTKSTSTPGFPTAAQSRSRRTSVPPKVVESREPAMEISRDRDMRPRSRGTIIQGKAASAEPPTTKRVTNDALRLREKRRASVVDGNHISEPSTIDGTSSSRSTRNGRRPAPGLVTADEDGKGKVSVGKRKAAPMKKGIADPADKGKKGDAPVDPGWDDVIDPDEPRYCLCGDVSYGTMIACENEDCEKEWFHLTCVNLTEIPPRRTKWYCPDCRVKKGIDGKGHLTDGGNRRR